MSTDENEAEPEFADKLADLVIVLRERAGTDMNDKGQHDEHGRRLAAVALEAVEALMDYEARGKSRAEVQHAMGEVVRLAQAVGT